MGTSRAAQDFDDLVLNTLWRVHNIPMVSVIFVQTLIKTIHRLNRVERAIGFLAWGEGEMWSTGGICLVAYVSTLASTCMEKRSETGEG